jgi:hypothetical protein
LWVPGLSISKISGYFRRYTPTTEERRGKTKSRFRLLVFVLSSRLPILYWQKLDDFRRLIMQSHFFLSAFIGMLYMGGLVQASPMRCSDVRPTVASSCAYTFRF